MPYRIEQHPSIEKQMSRIPNKAFDRICEKICSLAEDPRPRGCEKVKNYPHEFRVRVGDYRIRYKVYDSEQVIELIRVAPRGRVYDRHR